MDPAALKAIADAGGWTAFLGLCAVLGVGFVRRWLVPGWLYQIALDRADKLVEQLERNTNTLAKQTTNIRAIQGEVVELRAIIEAIRARAAVQRDRDDRTDAGP